MPSNTDWARSIATTIVDHIRGAESEILRNRRLGAMLVNKGRVQYNKSGRGFDWRVKYRTHTVSGNTGETPRTFTRINRHEVAELEYRGYQLTDAIFKKEKLENRGEPAIVELGETFVADMLESLDEAFAEEYYIDGEGSGNSLRMHGIESMMGTNGTVTITSGAQRSANAADIFGYPNSTYANLSCTLGSFGGAQKSGIWPNGTANAQYDFWTPIIVNYTSTGLPGSAATWASQGIEAMREGIIQCQRNAGLAGQMDMILLDRALYKEALNQLDDKERVIVTKTNGLKSFGFTNVFELDGVECSWEYGIPQTSNSNPVGYGFNVDNMELRSMQDQLFNSEMEYDIDSQADKFVTDFLGNLKYRSPRNFCKFMPHADM